METIFYLVQHAEAKSKEEDPERHLTKKGKEITKKIAEYLSKKGIKPDIIIHSGKTRARETAEIYAEYLKPDGGISEGEKLNPLDDPSFWAEKLKGENKSIMLVGHLPHLSKLASLLLIDNPEKEIIKFEYAGCLALKKEETFTIKFFIIPSLI